MDREKTVSTRPHPAVSRFMMTPPQPSPKGRENAEMELLDCAWQTFQRRRLENVSGGGEILSHVVVMSL